MEMRNTCESLERKVEEPEAPAREGKRLTEHLLEHRERLESLIKYNPLAVVTLDEKHRIVSCNRRFEEVFGYKESEILGADLDEVVVGEKEREQAVSHTTKVLKGEPIYGSGKRRGKGGRMMDVEFFGVPVIVDGRVVGIYAVYEDVSERRRKERIYRESEEKYKSILESVEEGYYELDLEGRFVFFNDALCKILGYPKDQLMGLNIRETAAGVGFVQGFGAFNRVYRTEKPLKGFDWPVRKGNGQTGHVEASVSLIRNADGEGIGFRGIMRDITEKAEMEKELNKTRKFLQNILDSSLDAITTMDLHGRIMYISPKVREIVGYAPEEILGRNIRFLMEDGEEDERRITGALQGEGELRNHEMRLISKTGEMVDVGLSASFLKDEKGDIIGSLVIFRDITEKKHLLAQLVQAQKMEALGTLAGGIAHNFNNLLMGIQGNAALTLMETGPDHPHRERLATIEKLVQSGSDLTRQLLGYAREGKYEIRPLDLRQLVDDTCKTFSLTRKDIRIHKRFQDKLAGVKADRGQLEQVLMNLFVNAADAMPRGGELFLEARKLSHKDMGRKPYRPKRGSYILLVVRDTGFGMDRKTRERAFEPFFTTKGLGRGTGLGLSSVYGIIKAHGGYIDVHSEEGIGTTFEIFLPTSETKAMKEKTVPKRIVKGRETLFLVDDEDMIVHVGKEILNRLGYRTLTARSGKEAIEIYAERHEEIDMVILDMVMPDMGGGEVYDRMKEINSGVKVLLSSGYSVEGQASEILDRGCNGFIQKPFNVKEISESIREVMEGAEADRLSLRGAV